MSDEFIPLFKALARGIAAVGDRAWPQLRSAIEKGKRGSAKCRADGKWGKLDPQWMGCLAEFVQGPEPVHPEQSDSAVSLGLARDYQTSSRPDGDMLYLDRERLHRQKVEGGPVRLTECVVLATLVDALWPAVTEASAPVVEVITGTIPEPLPEPKAASKLDWATCVTMAGGTKAAMAKWLSSQWNPDSMPGREALLVAHREEFGRTNGINEASIGTMAAPHKSAQAKRGGKRFHRV